MTIFGNCHDFFQCIFILKQLIQPISTNLFEGVVTHHIKRLKSSEDDY